MGKTGDAIENFLAVYTADQLNLLLTYTSGGLATAMLGWAQEGMDDYDSFYNKYGNTDEAREKLGNKIKDQLRKRN